MAPTSGRAASSPRTWCPMHWRSGAQSKSSATAGPRDFASGWVEGSSRAKINREMTGNTDCIEAVDRIRLASAKHSGGERRYMCGIVGILGSKPVAVDLVEALRRLEYRGYDSAGVATLENGHLDRRRAEGKLKNLELRLSNRPLDG